MKNLRDKITFTLKKELKKMEKTGLLKLPVPGEIPLSLSGTPQFGEFTTNIALQLRSERKPIFLANILTEGLKKIKRIERVEVKEPGFINIFLKKEFFYQVLCSVLKKGEEFGSSQIGKGKKVLIEFVSANPTGPLTIAHGRQAALGEAIAHILSANAYRVTKEYYLNDAGVQINLLGESLLARYKETLGLPFSIPTDGYFGEYLKEIAVNLKEKYGKGVLSRPKNFFSDYARIIILEGIKKDLHDFGVNFDSWFSEIKLHQGAEIKNALAKLKEKGYLYRKDGALWFKSTSFGDEKDRVLQKSDGNYTYLTPDIAYHRNKYKRGYHFLINLFGPDHDGYIPRLKGTLIASGYPPNSFFPIIVQLTTLYQGKKKLQMSTRKGEFITLHTLIKEVGADVAKHFFLSRKAESHLDFDLELAKKNSSENPAYYIQYAYARICSIMKFAREKGIPCGRRIKLSRLSPLKEKEELNLLRLIFQFPYLVETCGKTFHVQPILNFLQELAGNFHNYYNKSRVITKEKEITRARLLLIKGVGIILRKGLKLSGISTPEKM